MPSPLFSRRKAIADQCEQWCLNKKIPACPLNIITALASLGFLSSWRRKSPDKAEDAVRGSLKPKKK